VKALANAFLNHKRVLLDADELSPRTKMNCKEATDPLVSHFGKQRVVADLGPDDFAELRNKMAKKWGPVRVRDFVQRIRSVFKFGFDVGLLGPPDALRACLHSADKEDDPTRTRPEGSAHF
jgi:hypothetical protein